MFFCESEPQELTNSAAFHAGTTTTDLEEQWDNPLLGGLLKGVHNIFIKDPAQGAYSCFYAALHKDVVEKGWNGAYFTDAVCLCLRYQYLAFMNESIYSDLYRPFLSTCSLHPLFHCFTTCADKG